MPLRAAARLASGINFAKNKHLLLRHSLALKPGAGLRLKGD